ncbi:MAG TPA: FtsX-like permease family protein, partial [Blastocatellia bacterium]|nr:FtsX-like permease family protein [Blastocatellia bacterium]
IVRTSAQPEKFIAAVKGSVWAIDKDQPIYSINTAETLLSESLAEPRFYLLLFGVFAGATLGLVALGIYGVMAYLVTQRQHELGIRVALGAQPGDVVRLVLRDAMALIVVGLGCGLLAAFGLGRWLKNLLYEQSASDPLTFALISLLLAAVALAACWMPARRASRVDPLAALRAE